MTNEQLAGWFARFRFYRAPPSIDDIRAWVERFEEPDRPVAERALDLVRIISEEDIQRGYKEALEAIPGWNARADQREGRWVFLGFGGAGESGAEMLRKFREANRLSAQRHDDLFVTLADLASLELEAKDTVVFVDDFSGTGDQIVDHWPVHAEMAGGARSFLILTAATTDAVDRLLNLEQLDEILVSEVLPRSSNIFSNDCADFSADEKATLLSYCEAADNRNPKGFGECGLLFVLSHKTPNNSVPILHANKASWRGIFPRYLNV